MPNMQQGANTNNNDTHEATYDESPSTDDESLSSTDDEPLSTDDESLAFDDDQPYIQRPALLTAVTNNKVKRAGELLRHGADVNQVNSDNGKTALHLAVTLGKPRHMIRLLLEHGANVNAIDNEERTPLQCVVTGKNSHRDVIEPLLKAGARLHAIDDARANNVSLISTAIMIDQPCFLQTLFQYNTLPIGGAPTCGGFSRSPIHWATRLC